MSLSRARVQDLVGIVNRLYPPGLAESWDRVGLQVGDPTRELTCAAVALDPTPTTLKEAEAVGAQALVTHHPLIFHPLTSLTPQDPIGRVLWQAVQRELALVAVHTNLDRASPGLNDWLAATLKLRDTVPLEAAAGGDLFKCVVFVPLGYEDAVASALFAGGAGHIGNYDGCSFRHQGVGTFRPGADTTPFKGTAGKLERSPEVRLETIIPAEHLQRALARMEKAHPYEEVAYDLIPLANRRPDIGLGRIGRLQRPVKLATLAARIKKALGTRSLRLVGDASRQVAKVAVCGGSGSSLVPAALRQGADVLVTGDLKYHEALRAEQQGLAVIDAGHFATEHLAVAKLAEALDQAARERRLDLRFVALEGERDPLQTV